jgi:hypothetical protein
MATVKLSTLNRQLSTPERFRISGAPLLMASWENDV